MQQKNWYVIYTIPKWEKKVARLLSDAGLENYCPLNKVTKKWSDRKKVIEEPLFKGYVFVQISKSEIADVKSVKGVINFVHWLGKPAIVKDEDIANIKKFLRDHKEIEVTEYKIDINDKVMIDSGLLMNYQGIVEDILGSKVRIIIKSLGIQMVALVEKRNVRILS